jgi:hypothetical protein
MPGREVSLKMLQKQNCALAQQKNEKLQMADYQHYRFLFLRTFCAVAAMVKKQIFDASGYVTYATKTAPKMRLI